MRETVQDEFGSAEDYLAAFDILLREGIPERHIALLQAHHAEPAHTAPWARLATEVGYASGSAVNLQYGTLAKRVAHALGIHERPRGAWVFVLVDWGEGADTKTGHTTFALRRPVVEALERHGIAKRDSIHPEDADPRFSHSGTADARRTPAAPRESREPPRRADPGDGRARKSWRGDLRACALEMRGTTTVPARSDLTAAEEWKCRVIGGSLIQWLRTHGPRFLHERAALARLLDLDENPIVVFTSDAPGLVAASEILGDADERVVWMSRENFARFKDVHPDPEYVWHVHVWSIFIDPPDSDFLQKGRLTYPGDTKTEYWQHDDGTMWASNAGAGGSSLWRWDGLDLELLEEGLTRWVA